MNFKVALIIRNFCHSSDYQKINGWIVDLRKVEVDLETNSKIQNIRDLYRVINYFKKGYQPRCNIVKDGKGDLVADSHSIVARWRNYFSQLFNVHGFKDVRQAEIHTAEPLEPCQVPLRLSWLSIS